MDFAFEAAKKVLDYYESYFGIPSELPKLHQVAVPEFAYGAMENWGAITNREIRLHVDKDTTVQTKKAVASVIAHEIAHMWFGDLVTMRWWDDIWLNESFATYMGYRLTAEVTKWPQAWTRFGVGRKAWGYAADQRPTTHPVAPSDVSDTDAAFNNFDGISYAKGCSALRQLVAW